MIMIQEFNVGTNAQSELSQFVASLDPTFWWARGTGQIPNGIISRWPIVGSGEWPDPRVSNRTFAWALIDLPGPRELWVVSVHLLTANGSERDLEAHALLQVLDANVPTRDFLLVGGDFNTETTNEAALRTLQLRARSGPPYPADAVGNANTNAARAKPFDHVLASSCLSPNQVPVTIGAASFDAGLVFDTRSYMPLTDVPPALAGDSAAQNMQHMAVVKDFVVQP
ncbi:MAG: endonuclease/exonuclease/phosphatase family protein [Archangiaceae bacterium]|nr:endonuclease/exonuclease/phosphatase family protein [Archangiaceae bacterium]